MQPAPLNLPSEESIFAAAEQQLRRHIDEVRAERSRQGMPAYTTPVPSSHFLPRCYGAVLLPCSFQLCTGIAVAQVYVDWRASWLRKLYQPQPLHSNRIKDGELDERIEEGMVR